MDALHHCVVPSGGAELILVDNNCTDQTVERAQVLWNHPEIPLRVVKEDQAGLSYARVAGMRAARGELLLWVDDDNWLCVDYLAVLDRIFRDKPNVGIIGGRGIAEFGCAEPPWFSQHARTYAISSDADITGYVDIVFGAGMAIRREVYEQLQRARFRTKLTDRKGASLASGGDSEICLAARLIGWDIYFTVEATFRHFIPPERLNNDYLCRLQVGIGESMPTLSVYSFVFRYEKPLIVWFVSIIVFLRVVISYLRATCSYGKKDPRSVRLKAISTAWARLLPFKLVKLITSCGLLKKKLNYYVQ